MRALFLHNNFPAQFGPLASHMAARGHEIVFGTQREDVTPPAGVRIAQYKPHRDLQEGVHPYTAAFEKAVLNGQAAARMGLQLKRQGFSPDVIVAHSGWGPGFYMKDVWPDAKLVGYFEWYYQPNGPDVAFLSDTPQSEDELLRTRSRNAPILMDLGHGDWGICPTRWQASQFPELFQSRMTVQHDGVDTELYAPIEGAKLRLPSLDLSDAAEIVTYVARGMEPYRGFPSFMAAMETLQKARPQTHVVIVGADRVAYGKQPKDGKSYKTRALEDLELDPARTHFTGLLPRGQYRSVLQASSVHVYLTAPFVLSWSMMEAMSAGCLLIASDTAPVRELIEDGRNGLLVDFFDTDAIAARVGEALDAGSAMAPLRRAGRETIIRSYDARRLLKQRRLLIESVAEGLIPRGS